jgi:hypothetical protein
VSNTWRPTSLQKKASERLLDKISQEQDKAKDNKMFRYMYVRDMNKMFRYMYVRDMNKMFRYMYVYDMSGE